MLLQSGVSLISNAWLLYVGVLFIVMVTFAPGGLAGLFLMHQPLWRAGRLGRLAAPYARVIVPGVLVAAGFVLLVELCSFLTIGAAQGKAFTLGHLTIDPQTATPWMIGALLLVGGGLWLSAEGRRLRAVWERVLDEIKAAGPLP